MSMHLIRFFIATTLLAPIAPEGCTPLWSETLMIRHASGEDDGTTRGSGQSHFKKGGATRASGQSHFTVGGETRGSGQSHFKKDAP